jgi:beta-galactosidase
MDRIGFGAAYYAEYQRHPDIPADFALMAEAGFSVIRVGESVWSTWEPEDGRFELDWLEPVLDAAHRHDIGVILGTPTYAVPMWLTRRYPEIAAETAAGHRVGWGARQEVNFAHAAYRFHAERVIRAVVGRYAEHPAVIGYQVDNEPGLRLLYNADVFEKFVAWLRIRYGTVERLNEEWGLVYWSHRLSRWSELWRPDGNFQPQYDLAWRRFQAELVTEFIGWQAGLVRELTGGRGFVTTCISYEQPGIEDAELSRALDVASGNAYYEMQDALAHPGTLPRSTGPLGWVVRGPWAVTQLADLMYSSKQAPFLVTETNAGSIGFSSMNESPYDGQWRQVAWLLVARGARLVEYWQWNTLPYGTETYWGGVLPHSGIPGRAYREIARTGQELGEAGGAFVTAEPDYDIAVLYDSDSKFALTTQGPLRGEPFLDPDSYRHIVAAFSRGIFDAKRQQRLVRPQQLLPSRGGELDAAGAATRYPVLIAAAFYTAADEDLDFLVSYARAGGHLVVGPRTGYGDREARARLERAPGRIAEAAGVWYEEMASLPSPVPVHGSLPGTSLRGAATGFAELLVASGAEVLASYEHPHLGRWAAVTTRAAGAGRITVVGTVPDQDLAAGLVRWLAPQAVGGWTTGDSVTVSTSTDASTATRLHVLHNWSWEEATATASGAVTDLIGDGRHLPGEKITLGAWDVRLFRGDAGELSRRSVSGGAGACAGASWCPSARFWPGPDHRPG